MDAKVWGALFLQVDALAAPQNRPRRAAQGRYMTMSEVKGNFRNSILIPEIGWENFRDVLDD